MKIYCLDVSQLHMQDLFAKALSCVNKTRHDKVLLLRKEEAKRASLAAGLLMQYAVQQEGSVYDMERLSYTEKGKPYFPGNDICFNISHSGEKVFCVTSEKNIGCDIEKIRDSIPRHLHKILSISELEYFETLSDVAKKEYFFRVWTLKESIAKWNGLGLTFPFFDITVMDKDAELSGITYKENKVILYSGYLEGYMWAICSEEQKQKLEIEYMEILDIL